MPDWNNPKIWSYRKWSKHDWSKRDWPQHDWSQWPNEDWSQHDWSQWPSEDSDYRLEVFDTLEDLKDHVPWNYTRRWLSHSMEMPTG